MPPLIRMPLRATRAMAANITNGVASPSSAGEVQIVSVMIVRTSRVTKKTTIWNTNTTGI